MVLKDLNEFEEVRNAELKDMVNWVEEYEVTEVNFYEKPLAPRANKIK